MGKRVKTDRIGSRRRKCSTQRHCQVFFMAMLFCPGVCQSITEAGYTFLQVEYNGQSIEAAWPLGAAINDLSA